MSRESFQVFAGNEPYAPIKGPAIALIPISSISHVRRVKYDIGVKSQKLQGTKENQFEIFLKDQIDFESALFETTNNLQQTSNVQQLLNNSSSLTMSQNNEMVVGLSPQASSVLNLG